MKSKPKFGSAFTTKNTKDTKKNRAGAGNV